MWKFKQIKPQKARGKYTESLWTDPQWLAEEKYDGERRIGQFCGDVVRFTGCRESVDGSGYVEKSKQVPHLSNFALGKGGFGLIALQNAVRSLDGTVLDGEFVPPPGTKIQGGGSKYVTSVMGSHPLEAIRKQKERGYLCYKVFDCLWYKGEDIRSKTLGERRVFAAKAVAAWSNSYVAFTLAYYKESEKRRVYEAAIEGVVFKHIDQEYGDEKLWVKHKKAWTADVVVMGFTAGKGKYKGQIGAIEFGQNLKGTSTPDMYLEPMGQCSGFEESLRTGMSNKPSLYIGQVLEITHNGREPSGKFRHPQFSRFRADKSPKDCVYDQEET